MSGDIYEDDEDNCKCSLCEIINLKEARGIAHEKLRVLLDDEMFEIKWLDRHNPEFHSPDVSADTGLDWCRRKFCIIKDELWKIMEVLEGKNE